MAIGIGIVHPLNTLDAGDPAVVAKRAEELGFTSYWAPEHTVVPVGSADVYPGKRADEPREATVEGSGCGRVSDWLPSPGFQDRTRLD